MSVVFLFLLALSALSATAQTLTIVSGNGLIVQEAFPSTKPLRVRAVNSAGDGVQNIAITWTLKQGDGQFINVMGTTDSGGYATTEFFGARILQGESYISSIVTAASAFGSVDFAVTTVSTRSINGTFVGLPSASLIDPTATLTGPPGTVFPRAFGVRVAAQAGLGVGQGIPNVGVRITDPDPDQPTAAYARCSGAGNVVLTDATGVAYCDLVLGTNPGFNFLSVDVGEVLRFDRRIPITITPGAACTFNVNPLTQNVAGAGGSSTIAVTVATGTSCSWTASTGTPWLTINSGTTGQGSGTVAFTAATNPGAARTGTITVAGRTVTINQAAAGSPGTGGPLTFITNSPFPAGVVGIPYTLQLSTSGGTAPFVWTAEGTFAPGLGLTPSNGFVTGTPTLAGTFAFTLRVVDALGASVSRPFTMTVSPPSTGAGLSIITTSLVNGAVGAAYQQAVTATGACGSNPFGGGAVNWSLVSGSLPPGLTFGTSGPSINISGTPTAEGTFTFSLRAADTCGRSDTRPLTLVISSVVTQTPMTATPTNVEFSVAFTAANSPEQSIALSTGAANLTFTAATTTPWLRVSPASGPTPGNITVQAINIATFAPGTYNGAVTVTSGASNSPLTIPVALRVASPSNISVSPESLLFRHTPAAPISQQNLTVGGASTGIRFFVTSTTDSGGSWLSVTPTSGSTSATLAVAVNTTGFQPGTYTGIVRVVPDANAAGVRVVPVTVIVSPQSTITVPQTPLIFSGPGAQTLAITSTGAPIAFTAAATGGTWLSVTPTSGNAPSSVTVTADIAGLAQGQYQGTVVITPANTGQPIAIPVVLNVTQGQPVISAITNGASFAPGSVAPGELVTLFGTNLGPATLTSADFDASGTLQTSVANVRVLFDNVAAPIIYVASNQVSAIVPFGVFGRTSTRVQLVNNNLQSNEISLAVADAAPGIFVLDASGQGAVLNQDGSVNAQLNGAAPGDIIAIYATGAGQLDRQVFDGRRVTDQPFPRPLLPIGVRIGGRVADVVYAGAAPSLVAGMIQVNARIPADTPRGTTVSVQILVGNATSQANVVLSTR